jgi:hypothetical protein
MSSPRKPIPTQQIKQINDEIKRSNLTMFPTLTITITKPDGKPMTPPNSPKTPAKKG